MEDIDSGLAALAEDVIRLKIRSIAIPPLGSGLGGLDWPVVHKLMYFMQEAGAPLRLQYEKAPYGPYARNLGHVLKRIEGHLISGYADGGDAPTKQLKLVPGATEDAKRLLQNRSRFQRVSELVEGFESPFGLELLATVHWVAKKEGARTLQEVTAKTFAWNERKKQFSPRQIDVAA